MPLAIVDGFASAGDFDRVLVLELNLNASAPQPQHEPRVLQRFSVQHYTLRIERPEIELGGEPVTDEQNFKTLIVL